MIIITRIPYLGYPNTLIYNKTLFTCNVWTICNLLLLLVMAIVNFIAVVLHTKTHKWRQQRLPLLLVEEKLVLV